MAAPLLPSKQAPIAIFVGETGRQDGSDTRFQRALLIASKLNSMRDEIRALSDRMLRLDSSAWAVTQEMHAISGLLGIALAASQRGIERLDQDGLGCLGAPAAPLLPRPSEGDKPRQVERSPAPGPPVFFLSLFARAFFVAGFEPGARRGARLPSNHCGPPEVFRFVRRGMPCVTRAERIRRISGGGVPEACRQEIAPASGICGPGCHCALQNYVCDF